MSACRRWGYDVRVSCCILCVVLHPMSWCSGGATGGGGAGGKLSPYDFFFSGQPHGHDDTTLPHYEMLCWKNFEVAKKNVSDVSESPPPPPPKQTPWRRPCPDVCIHFHWHCRTRCGKMLCAIWPLHISLFIKQYGEAKVFEKAGKICSFAKASKEIKLYVL